MNYHAIWMGLGLSLGVATAAAVPAPERLLPADTMLLATLPDWETAATGWQQNPLHRFWNDPAMGPFREKLTTAFRRELLAPFEGQTDVRLGELVGLLRGQLTLALVQRGWPDRAGSQPALLILADTGDRAERMGELLGEWRKKLQEAGTPVTELQIGDRDFFSARLSDGSFNGATETPGQQAVHVIIGRSDTLFVMGTELSVIEQVLERQSGKTTSSALADFPLFRQDFDAGLRQAHGYGWVNLQPALSYLERLARAQEADGEGSMALFQPTKLMAAVGIHGLRSLGFSALLAADGSHIEMLVGLPEADRTGLMKLLIPEAKDASPPAFVPADVARFQRIRLDLSQAWSTLEDLVFTVLPTARGIVEMMFSSVGKDQDPNFDLRRELFGNLGDDLMVIERAPAEHSLASLGSPPTLILLGSPAPDRMAVALKALAGLLPPPLNQLEETVINGRRVYGLRLSAAGDDPEPTPTLGFVGGDGYLAISMERDLLMDFAHNKPMEDGRLRDVPGLGEAAAQVGGVSNGLFGYENDRLTARTMVEALRNDAGLIEQMLGMTPFGQHLDGSEGRSMRDWVDFSLLPPFDRVERHFGFSVYGVSVRPEGVRYRMFTPAPRQNEAPDNSAR
jgi:hypothetical protein